VFIGIALELTELFSHTFLDGCLADFDCLDDLLDTSLDPDGVLFVSKLLCQTTLSLTYSIEEVPTCPFSYIIMIEAEENIRFPSIVRPS
jgi:hypothetical protein